MEIMDSPLVSMHYACLIELLACAGCLDEAFKLIKEMPFEPSKSIWGSFLTCCRPYGNLELSDIADKKLAELESDNVLIMLLLSTLHAEVGRHGDGAGGEVMTNEREWTYGVG
jgi:pentatricopeptide repeat protein